MKIMVCIVSNFSYKTLRNDDLIHLIQFWRLNNLKQNLLLKPILKMSWHMEWKIATKMLLLYAK